jgi:flagellin-like hook-associated protein FlgL
VGLRVNNNIAAMNAYRNLSVTDGQMSKSLEKLSSGFRINRAADDAAGLAISEGLRSQIGGLKVAVRNTQDGISVVQTAEGALTETHSILQRMRDLSVQASNSGSLSDDAKGNIQSEIVQLKAELDRIADTTSFNGKKLLDGNYNAVFQVGANAGETIAVNLGTAMGSTGLAVSGIDVTGDGTFTNGTAAANKVITTAATAGTAATNAAELKFQASGAAGTTDWDDDAQAAAEFRKLDGTISFAGKTFDLGTVDYDAAAGSDSTLTASEALTALNTAAKSALGLTANPFTVDTGAANELNFVVADAVDGFTAANGAPVNGATASVGDLSRATATFAAASGAEAAIEALDTAIQTVSTSRAQIGAIQNRFDHTVNNLNVAVENLTASESRIRDADMAQEMVSFTRHQILSQAGTAMLAQANQASQGVLQLLR